MYLFILIWPHSRRPHSLTLSFLSNNSSNNTVTGSILQEDLVHRYQRNLINAFFNFRLFDQKDELLYGLTLEHGIVISYGRTPEGNNLDLIRPLVQNMHQFHSMIGIMLLSNSSIGNELVDQLLQMEEFTMLVIQHQPQGDFHHQDDIMQFLISNKLTILEQTGNKVSAEMNDNILRQHLAIYPTDSNLESIQRGYLLVY